MKSNSIKEIVLAADHQFGVLQIERVGKATRLYGVALGAAIEIALQQVHESGVRVTLAVLEALPGESIQLLKRLLPFVSSVISGAEATTALAAEARDRMVVAADRVMRGRAVKAGCRASPHLSIAAMELRGGAARFVRAAGPRTSFERWPGLIPYFAEPEGDGRIVVLGVVSKEMLARAKSLAIEVEELALDLAVEDPMFVRFDEEGQRDQLVACRILYKEKMRALIALPPETMNDEVGVHGEHGHFLSLSPSPLLLKPAPSPEDGLRRARLALYRWPSFKLSEIRVTPDFLRWLLFPCPMTAAEYQNTVNRYSGAANLDAAGPIVSRHIRHPDNARAVQALLSELTAIGYCAYTHSFTHAGQTYHNVIADLPGTGYLRIRPWVLESIRNVLLKYPWPDPPDPWLKALRKLGGERWVRGLQLTTMKSFEARREVLRLAALEHWYPWWIRRCRLPGFGAQLVILGCHLDSTAAFRAGGYNPASDPAPGADDDASGIAATLAVARFMWQFRDTLPHTVRFCFFNAEEQGLVGSRAYAQHLKAAGAPIRAVLCSDMIGYNSDANRIFEIHAGHTDAATRDASVPIADTIASWAATLGRLAPAQIYRGTSSGAGSDRTLFDGAIGRSDHASFHEQGYPAVVVSEDFFINNPLEPLKDSNPNYHDEDDLVIDAAYAADITCALAYAVKELAGG